MTTKASRRVEMTAALEWAMEFLPHYLTESPCGFHAELMGDLENADKRLIARVAPRGHGKSVIACLAYPLWCICEQKRRNIVIVTHEQGLATGFVRTRTVSRRAAQATSG